jgi:hypothetical protein
MYMLVKYMSGKNLLEGPHGPVSQSFEAVKALLTWKGRALDPLPSVLEFTKDSEDGRLVLVLSNRKDNYYVVTAPACSCPAASYHQGPCPHMKKYFPQAARVEQQPQTDSIRPLSSIPGSLENAEVIPLMLIDQYDTTDREVAYHSITEDKAMWPLEA